MLPVLTGHFSLDVDALGQKQAVRCAQLRLLAQAVLSVVHCEVGGTPWRHVAGLRVARSPDRARSCLLASAVMQTQLTDNGVCSFCTLGRMASTYAHC